MQSIGIIELVAIVTLASKSILKDFYVLTTMFNNRLEDSIHDFDQAI